MKDFPNVKFVAMIRDYPDVATSLFYFFNEQTGVYTLHRDAIRQYKDGSD